MERHRRTELVPAPEDADELAPVAKDDNELFYNESKRQRAFIHGQTSAVTRDREVEEGPTVSQVEQLRGRGEHLRRQLGRRAAGARAEREGRLARRRRAVGYAQVLHRVLAMSSGKR